ncbi:MAG: GNAT family N-acetyltransferase [Gammaproteobacteria bacterium]|nr:GNAT family N-acetyltransferase [Gammaproteobacteria bacterium]
MNASATVIETERLMLRCLRPEDAPFVLQLLNDPGWLQYIGDRGVRDLDAARAYIVDGPMAMVAQYGFGLWHTALRQGGQPIGLCGLLKRDHLDDIDLGFGFLAAHVGQGYAYEASRAVLKHARAVLGLRRVVAVTTVANTRSDALLRRLGFGYETMIDWPGGERLRLLACTPEAAEDVS